MEQAFIITLISVLFTNIILAYQIYLLRKQLFLSSQDNLTSKWNYVSSYEINNSDFHKMLLCPSTMKKIENLSNAELKERAFAHLVFDVLSDEFRHRKGKISVGVETYLREVLGNDKMRRYWKEYGICDAWKDDEFAKIINEIINSHENQDNK